MSNLNRIVYLSEAEYQTLIDNGTITKGGRTITYNANDIYITPEAGPLDEYSTINTFPVIGKSGHIYVALNTNILYRWDGIGYVEISECPTATDSQIKQGTASTQMISPYNQEISIFYGLAKAAGADMKDIAFTTVGVYPDTQKTAIQTMLGVPSSTALNNKADKTDTVLETTLSRGRKANTVIGEGSFAFGNNVEASGYYSAAFGSGTASGLQSFATGNTTVASGSSSVAMGSRSVASGNMSHAEGLATTASGNFSYVEGSGTIAASDYQHAQGKYNIADSNGTYALIIGNGAYNTPSNAYALTWTGDGKYAGDVYVGCNDDSTGGTKVATLTDISAKVDKVALDDAGISARTYTELFGGEFSVTTATTSGYNNPYARASVTGRISKHYLHRVTFNDTEYILPTRLWFNDSTSSVKVYEYLGNIGLYISSTSGVPGGTDNVPFVIISDLNNSSSIDVLTSTAGSYTFKVEQITPTQKMLPPSLIYKDDYVPILKNNNSGTYNGFSIGVNELTNTRGTVAIGYGNKIGNEFSNVIGNANTTSRPNTIIYGNNNTATEAGSIAIGFKNTVSGNSAVAIGYNNTANSTDMVAVGKNNVPANTDFPMWQNNTQYKKGDIFKATMQPIPGVTTTMTIVCKDDYLSASSGSFDDDTGKTGKTALAPSNGDTMFVVGNGGGPNSRSNALKVDLVGNQYIGGNMYVNCDADSTNGTKLATINEVVTDVQVNGTSVVSNGVANIPTADGYTFGAVKVVASNGIYSSSGTLQINKANSEQIKEGTATFHPIVPYNEYEAVFYGLAKAAGDTTQSASSNAVGTYTAAAKTAIKSMIDIQEGLEVVRLI